jgi:F0F1-type ATP synthase delta subunit
MNSIITSATELSETQKKKVISALEKKYPNTQVTFIVDETTIGGVKITVGSKQIDMTLQGQLLQLQKTLKKEDQHGK